MINVSREFRNAMLENGGRWIEHVDITIDDAKELHLTNENLWEGGVSIEDAVSSDNAFEVGAAIINKCDLTINNIYDEFSKYDFGGARVVVYIGLELPNGTVERARKGTYTVDEAKYNGSIISLSCLDYMTKFDKLYSESHLTYPATLESIILNACVVCGVELNTYNFPRKDFVIENRPSDEATTFREVISWCAQIACCFCRCDVYGRLELKWYDQEALERADLDGGIFDRTDENFYQSGDSADGGRFKPWDVGYEFDGGKFEDLKGIHHIYSNYSVSISTDDVVITGVRVIEKTEEENSDAVVVYQSGSDGYVASIENNDLIQNGSGQAISGWMGEQLIGFRFRKASVSHSSDPTIEAGDVAFLTDRKGNSYPIIVSSTKFSTGGAQSTISAAEEPARNSAARFSAETKNYVEYRKGIEKERTDREKALEGLKKRIDESPGLFTTEETLPDGGKIFYMHNKPSLADSDIVWKMTAEAWGVSTDGGKTYNAGMTVDGDTIVRILTTVGVNADWMKTGAIRIEKNGKVMANLDYDTKRVELYPDVFALSNGKTIESIAEEAVNGQTQDDILNKLTNNGKNKGIYMQNGELYMNATYIKTGEFSADRIHGGTLTLGGANNVNGKLSIRNASNAEIGQWDKDGIYVNGGSVYCKTDTSGVSIYGGRMHLTHDSTEVGDIGTNYMSGYTSYKGLTFDLESSGAYMAWAAKATTASSTYAAKMLYANKTFSNYTAGKMYISCDMDFMNYEIQNAYINGLHVRNFLNIPNNVDCDVYSNIDFHNYEVQNIKINNLSGINGYAPYDGTINYSYYKNGTYYSGTLTVKDGIIIGASGGS